MPVYPFYPSGTTPTQLSVITALNANGGCMAPDSTSFYTITASNIGEISLPNLNYNGTVSSSAGGSGKTCSVQPDKPQTLWEIQSTTSANNINIFSIPNFELLTSLLVTGPNEDIVFIP